MRKFWKILSGMLFLSGVALVFSACQKDPVIESQPTESDIIRGEYIVVYQDGIKIKSEGVLSYEQGISEVTDATLELLREYRVAEEKLGYVYAFALEGFSATLTDDEFVALRNDPRVNYIEPNQVVSISATQVNATWGLDRVDQRDLPLNQTYNYNATGTGVRAYIIDTGIRYAHVDFGGRASFGFDAFGGDGSDGNGHGTHVAGTVGGATYGIAKNVSLVAVRVLDRRGSGTTSGVIAGMDWVTANHVKPAVANMSLAGGVSTATDDAVARMFNAGVPVIVAASNEGRDACNYSPARAPKAYTIGATTNTDAKASYSNYGNCVNLFAPGSSITSAWHTNNTATNTISGTSMASPHVAGAAALFLQNNTNATPQQVYDALTNTSTKNKVTISNTTNNHLLFTLDFGGGGGEDPPPANEPPVASFTYSTDGLTILVDGSGSSDPENGPLTYAWNFGDGTNKTGATASHIYSAGGTFSVKLTVTDNGGLSDSETKSVTVTAPPSGDDVAPVVNTFDVTKKTAGPWRVATISWAVSDANGDLSTVRLELLSGTTVLESANISVSGSTASGSTELKSRTQPDAVKIIVTDSKGNTDIKTLTY